jgi:hypothetical protein
MTLAFVHNLAIGRNIPAGAAISLLTGLVPVAVIKFAQKSDPTNQNMLTLREDILDDYSEEIFEVALVKNARIVDANTVYSAGRWLYWYNRK